MRSSVSLSGARLKCRLALQQNLDANLHHMVQAIVTILAVINPVVCGLIFLTLTPKLTVAQRRRAAVGAALSILIVLVASSIIGLKILNIFNISLDVFRIVGEMIIAYMGFDMLSGRHTVGQAGWGYRGGPSACATIAYRP